MNRNFGDARGPVPGPKGAVKQHHAMASGYELPATKRCVKINQRSGETGEACAPGLTHHSRYKR